MKFASYSTDRLTEKGSYDLENGEQHSLSGKFDVQYNKNFLSVHDIFVNAGFDLSRKQSSTNLQQAEGFPSDKMTDIIFPDFVNVSPKNHLQIMGRYVDVVS